MGGGGCTGSFGHKSLINVFARKRAEIQTKISLKKSLSREFHNNTPDGGM